MDPRGVIDRLVELQMERERIRERMQLVKHKLAVMSGKGGVGKSVIAANLAVALSLRGWDVGILDADIHGPSIPKILGVRGMKLQAGPPGIFPMEGPSGVKVASMDLILPRDETPVIWRGPMKMSAIRQFLADVAWGRLDYLVFDLPPGTGDEPLSVLQLLPEMDGVLIVTIPSEVSRIVIKKAVSFARELKTPILGIIENMSGFVCPHCGAETPIFKVGGGEEVSREMGVPFLGRIPLDPRICEASDEGIPFILENPRARAAEAFMKITAKIEDDIRMRRASQGRG
ncbi:MAG: Mrp/NBP35 family ATP-binding protein [Candidatus Bathyarchaeia archaeon]|nr:Mrp/NBP35 family ATP-binding protein [Candidatus Bathyarchaeota archaeon]